MEFFASFALALICILGCLLVVACLAAPFVMAIKTPLPTLPKWVSLIISLALVYTTGFIGVGVYYVVYYFLNDKKNNESKTLLND